MRLSISGYWKMCKMCIYRCTYISNRKWESYKVHGSTYCVRRHPPYWLTENGWAVRSFYVAMWRHRSRSLLNFTMQPTRFDLDLSHHLGYKDLCAKQLSMESNYILRVLRDVNYDDVIKWKHFPRYWSFVRGIHVSRANSPHKGQWHGALMYFWCTPEQTIE